MRACYGYQHNQTSHSTKTDCQQAHGSLLVMDHKTPANIPLICGGMLLCKLLQPKEERAITSLEEYMSHDRQWGPQLTHVELVSRLDLHNQQVRTCRQRRKHLIEAGHDPVMLYLDGI